MVAKWHTLKIMVDLITLDKHMIKIKIFFISMDMEGTVG